jgi:hypothetical protein
MPLTDSADKFLRSLDLAEKVRAFAETLGCTGKQVDVFCNVFGSDERYFIWDGVRLLWKHNGETSIAVDDPNCKKWLQSEYDFLVPKPKAQVDDRGALAHHALDPELIDRALGGNQTAKSQIATALAGGGKVDDAQVVELFLKAEAQKRRGERVDVRLPANRKALDYTGDNPFTRLRLPSGAVNKEAEAEIAEITRTQGFAETKRLADAAGVNLSGHPLPGRKYA